MWRSDRWTAGRIPARKPLAGRSRRGLVLHGRQVVGRSPISRAGVALRRDRRRGEHYKQLQTFPTPP